MQLDNVYLILEMDTISLAKNIKFAPITGDYRYYSYVTLCHCADIAPPAIFLPLYAWRRSSRRPTAMTLRRCTAFAYVYFHVCHE